MGHTEDVPGVVFDVVVRGTVVKWDSRAPAGFEGRWMQKDGLGWHLEEAVVIRVVAPEEDCK